MEHFYLSDLDDVSCGAECRDLHYHMINYFDNPILTKVKDTINSTVYAVRTDRVDMNKYLICITPRDDMRVGDQVYMSQLPWMVLQTRTLREGFPVDVHEYTVKRSEPFSTRFRRVEKGEEFCRYVRDVGDVGGISANVSLLYNDRQTSEFATKTLLVSCIESYVCVIKADNTPRIEPTPRLPVLID